MSKSRCRSYPALQAMQGERAVYSFFVEGKDIESFASISRAHRSFNELEGYQRQEVRAHVADIRRYLETDRALLPNSIVIAFDPTVRFIPDVASAPGLSGRGVRPGQLEIPVDDSEKPGWIVDGQQRTAALRDADRNGFPVCVTAFIANTSDEQRSQFILVNSAKPLSRSLVYELLPLTNERLSDKLEARRVPAEIMERMNNDQDSPMRGLVQTATATQGVIKDNSVLRMVENSIADGALFVHRRGGEQGAHDIEGMLRLLKVFWGDVANVFKDAWGVSPRKSRLMHGVGILSLGYFMDAVCHRNIRNGKAMYDGFLKDLEEIAPACRWTAGVWEFRNGTVRHWNELQNVQRDILLVADHILYSYRDSS